MAKKELSQEGKDQIALALVLLNDYKCDGKFVPEHTMFMYQLAEYLNVTKEFDKIKAMGRFKITQRD